MNELKGRREFMQLLGLGGVVFASGLAGACTNILRKSGEAEDDFFFVQLSDTHWGFKGPPNPEAANTLKQAVHAGNARPRPAQFLPLFRRPPPTAHPQGPRQQSPCP